MLEEFVTRSVAAWYNRLLLREAWARATLRPYAGRSARIALGPIAIFLGIDPAGELRVGRGEPSVTVNLEPKALGDALLDPVAPRRRLHIDGDAAFAQVLTDVLQRLRPDPAEDLARWVGDAPAERIVSLLHQGLSWARAAAGSTVRRGVDYFVAEDPQLLGRADWEDFRAALALTADSLTILEGRIASLGAGRRRAPDAGR